MRRPDNLEYYLEIAKAVSKRSTCIRRKYGAVIVNNDEIIATGYNGAPRKEANCDDLGICYRVQNNIPNGQQYEKCRAVHAEQNALLSTSRRDAIDGIIYIYGYDCINNKEIEAIPCEICFPMIKNMGLKAYGNISGYKEVY
jgi:dCMP deaminase